MRLDWKSYGDTGLVAKGDEGKWITYTDGEWWHLALDNQRRGRFRTRRAAKRRAQDYEESRRPR